MKNCDVIEILLPNPRSTCWISWLGGGGAKPSRKKQNSAPKLPGSLHLVPTLTSRSRSGLTRGYASLAKSVKSTKNTIPFPIYCVTFPFGTTGMGLTPIGVRPDHVIKGANQRTLGAGNGERVGVGGWHRRKKLCKLVQKYHRWCFDILVLLAAADSLGLTTHTFVE